MSSENPARHPNAHEVAQDFGYTSVENMAQTGTIPYRSQILGVGATIATLGKEMALYRSDIHWTNIAPEYTNPEIVEYAMAPSYNIDLETWDFQTISDILPENTFDRIYCHGDDINNLSPETRQALGRALVNLLGNGGLLRVIYSDENFIENATYKEIKGEVIYSKPKVLTTGENDKYLTHIPPAPDNSMANRVRRHIPMVSEYKNTDIKPFEKMSDITARVIMAGLYALSAILERSMRKKSGLYK